MATLPDLMQTALNRYRNCDKEVPEQVRLRHMWLKPAYQREDPRKTSFTESAMTRRRPGGVLCATDAARMQMNRDQVFSAKNKTLCSFQYIIKCGFYIVES